ncbi:hypothetical protein EVAR_87512_1 [Eumeta japonica]|uniref:Uncharacterized protein n=1 Tax=Eumeta variegata TaxID=151549 RepID=A0A4C1Z6A8_EUMVA|nr:hypothetical protein EVAR_87512_1 [Eumeta japonica]
MTRSFGFASCRISLGLAKRQNVTTSILSLRIEKRDLILCKSSHTDELLRECCARGRPIIVEWERDARHSAGLSLVRYDESSTNKIRSRTKEKPTNQNKKEEQQNRYRSQKLKWQWAGLISHRTDTMGAEKFSSGNHELDLTTWEDISIE